MGEDYNWQQGGKHSVYFYIYGDCIIWGGYTAKVIKYFIDIIKKTLNLCFHGTINIIILLKTIKNLMIRFLIV